MTDLPCVHNPPAKSGNQIYVNRGAGVFIGNRQAARILIDWRTTRNVYTIAGQGTGRAGANTNLYIDASGRYPLGESTFNFPPPGSAFNKTKYAEWKAGKRKLVHASHLPLFRKLQEQEATEKNNAGACVLAQIDQWRSEST